MSVPAGKRIVAAADLGSQTFRLAVVSTNGSDAELLASKLTNVRLGEGLASAGLLSENAVEKAVDALRGFRKILREYRVDELRVCGTAALRHARNSDYFIERAGAEGFEVEVLSGEEEARTSAKGVSYSLPDIASPFLVVDIGGGSSEFVLVRDGNILYSQSLKLGAVGLTEVFLRSDPPRPEELEGLRQDVRRRIYDLQCLLPVPPAAIVGVGGTVTTLAAVAQDMGRYDPSRIRGYILSLETLEALWTSLVAMGLRDRGQVKGIDPRRADIMPAGLAIVHEVLNALRRRELVVTDGGLLLGLLVSLFEKESVTDVKSIHPTGLYI
jgi:exopolyphosphatase/guanosine-5'-triphosphate,3'-diphosphate pyrophosphatase